MKKNKQEENDWDLRNMTPQALANAKAPEPGSKPKCKDGKHSPGWYVGYACTKCGDVD